LICATQVENEAARVAKHTPHFGAEPTEPLYVFGLILVAVCLLAQKGKWRRGDNKVNAVIRETLEKFQRIA
jgi:hypothetical protein